MDFRLSDIQTEAARNMTYKSVVRVRCTSSFKLKGSFNKEIALEDI
jgi:hypothetical protein